MKPTTPGVGGCLRRLLLIAGLALLALYAVGVAAGYIWLHHVRHIERVTIVDVALFRVAAVRRGIAAEQFAQARKEAEAQNHQAAFLNFTSAVRNDPANVPGRLAAANFLSALGAVGQAVQMLEDGLVESPDDSRLIVPTFDLLTSTGRDEQALGLLAGRLASGYSGPNGPMLRSYEVLATLNHAGAAAAKKLLEQHPDLPNYRPAVPVVARVLWESAERLKAIEVLAKYLETGPAAYPVYVQLAGWQREGGLAADAIQTARRAGVQFPGELPPRIMLIEMLAASAETRTAGQAIEAYLRDFPGRPEALTLLAEAAGRNGWVEIARSLYEVGANRQPELKLFALFYADALARSARFQENQQVLAQIETQVAESNTAFQILLRQRQVIAAASLGDTDNVRELARRLAALLRSNPEALESNRRNFQRLGIKEAVTELSSRPPAAPPGTKRP